ncbi:VOC family protein [Yinghuangia sp. YIM S09857]|uniref:VOC family protein n=1 Tax=Yinghuangia sp. YIM S09857 TaxID=3436929 RepID=UPI003F534F01
MFEDSKAFSGFAVQDIAAAKEFYDRLLGVSTIERNGLLELHLSGGTTVLVYPKENHTPATFTILNFPVPDIEKAVDELTARGVAMQRYDGFEADEKGICRDPAGPPIAWFTDPSGNILSVLEVA